MLRIGDLPHNLALAYPRPITFVGKMPEAYAWTRQLYEKLGAAIAFGSSAAHATGGPS